MTAVMTPPVEGRRSLLTTSQQMQCCMQGAPTVHPPLLTQCSTHGCGMHCTVRQGLGTFVMHRIHEMGPNHGHLLQLRGLPQNRGNGPAKRDTHRRKFDINTSRTSILAHLLCKFGLCGGGDVLRPTSSAGGGVELELLKTERFSGLTLLSQPCGWRPGVCSCADDEG